MKILWQTEGNRLACRCSEVGQAVPYRAPWMESATKESYKEHVLPRCLDFRRLSPFGGTYWFVRSRVW